MTLREEILHGNSARQNLDILKHLLKSSDTPGGTPETLDTQQQDSAPPSEIATSNNQEATFGNDPEHFGTEIEDLLHFVDKFDFRSPLANNKKRNQTRPSPDPPQSARSEQHHHNKNGSSPVRGQDPSVLQTPKTAPVGRRVPLTERTNKTFLHNMETTKTDLHGVLFKEEADRSGEKAQQQYQQKRSSTMNSPLGDPEGLLLADDDRPEINALPQQAEGEEEVIPTVTDNDWKKFNHLLRNVEQALREAKAEKEAARLWAKEVRETTQSWVEAQQMLIELEKENAIEGRGDDENQQYPQKELNEKEMEFYEARIERLENSIRGLEVDLKTTELHHQTNEKRLLGIIQYQQEHLRKLEGIRGTMSVESGQRLNARSTPFPVRNLVGGQQNGFHRAQSFEEKYNLEEFSSTIQKELYFSEESSTTGPTQDGGRKSGAPLVSTATQTSPAHQFTRTSNGRRTVTLPTGAEFITRPDGKSSIRYPNGDVQISSPNTNRSAAFYHADSKVIQVVAKDGSEIYEFPNKQVERHYPDGRKIVKWPDGTKKRFFPNGTMETFLPDGKFCVEHPDGTKHVKSLLV